MKIGISADANAQFALEMLHRNAYEPIIHVQRGVFGRVAGDAEAERYIEFLCQKRFNWRVYALLFYEIESDVGVFFFNLCYGLEYICLKRLEVCSVLDANKLGLAVREGPKSRHHGVVGR